MFHGGPIGGGPGLMGGGPMRGPGGPMGRRFDEEEENIKLSLDARVLKWLGKYVWWVKRWLAFGGLGTLIRTGVTLTMPYLVKIATDNYIANKNVNGLTLIALAYVGVAIMMWVGQFLEMLNFSMAGQKVLYRLRTEMFDHLQELSLGFFSVNKVGKLMSRVQNDVEQLQMLLTQDIINIVTNSITLLAIIVIMLTMNARLALITFTVLPVLAIIMVIWQRIARRAFNKARRTIAVVNDQLQEGISGVRVIQNLTREETNFMQFDSANRANLEANIRAARLQAFMMPVIQILTNAAYAMVLVFGGFQIIEGKMTTGVLISFLLYIQQFFNPVMMLIQLYSSLQMALASGVRIHELLHVEPEIKDKPDAIELPPIKGKISFKNVSFAYEPGTDVLHDINFTISPGETVAIAGKTGAGKSSLASLIARFYDVSKGEVLLDGYNVKSVTQESLRKQISIVPQDPFLFSGTIEDNIRYGRLDAPQDEIIRAAQLAGAHDFITRLDKGYQTQVGERGGNLSAGQRQLICLARAILANPPILILDEATSNIDTNTERIMQASLRQVSQGRTTVIIAHRLSTITHADRIIVLQNGKIVETGNHRELMNQKGLYYKMFQTLSAQAGIG